VYSVIPETSEEVGPVGMLARLGAVASELEELQEELSLEMAFRMPPL